MRQKLGESLASVQKFDKPLEEATTSSLEALKAFFLGDQQHMASEDWSQYPFFQRAIELDPNFALAYGCLGVAYGNLDQSDFAEKFLKDAFDRRTRTSERERMERCKWRQSLRAKCGYPHRRRIAQAQDAGYDHAIYSSRPGFPACGSRAAGTN